MNLSNSHKVRKLRHLHEGSRRWQKLQQQALLLAESCLSTNLSLGSVGLAGRNSSFEYYIDNGGKVIFFF